MAARRRAPRRSELDQPRATRVDHLEPSVEALDARLSLAAGDTVGAVCALRHRAVLRAAPEPLLRADADTTYVLLTHLTRAWSTGARQARLAAAPLRAASCRTALEDT